MPVAPGSARQTGRSVSEQNHRESCRGVNVAGAGRAAPSSTGLQSAIHMCQPPFQDLTAL